MNFTKSWAAWPMLALAAGPAWAGLGGDVAGISADAAALQAHQESDATAAAARTPEQATRQQATPGVTRYTLDLPNGGHAVEFANSAGQVFAVSWSAPTMPNLAVLLGNNKARFDAAQASHGARAPRSLHAFKAADGDLVVFSRGHMHAYQGYAYLRSEVPSGFDLAELGS